MPPVGQLGAASTVPPPRGLADMGSVVTEQLDLFGASPAPLRGEPALADPVDVAPLSCPVPAPLAALRALDGVLAAAGPPVVPAAPTPAPALPRGPQLLASKLAAAEEAARRDLAAVVEPPELAPEAEARAAPLRRHWVPDGRSWLAVVAAAARTEGARLEDVLGDRKFQSVSLARQRAWYDLRALADPTPSYPELARAFGKRSHQAVLSGVRAHAERLAGYESAPTPAPAIVPGAVPAGADFSSELASRSLPDGRTWLDVATEACRAAGADLVGFLRGPKGGGGRATICARHLTWYALAEGARYSYTEIARVWGADASTVRSAIERIGAQRREAAGERVRWVEPVGAARAS